MRVCITCDIGLLINRGDEIHLCCATLMRALVLWKALHLLYICYHYIQKHGPIMRLHNKPTQLRVTTAPLSDSTAPTKYIYIRLTKLKCRSGKIDSPSELKYPDVSCDANPRCTNVRRHGFPAMEGECTSKLYSTHQENVWQWFQNWYCFTESRFWKNRQKYNQKKLLGPICVYLWKYNINCIRVKSPKFKIII